mgnify:FL=1
MKKTNKQYNDISNNEAIADESFAESEQYDVPEGTKYPVIMLRGLVIFP